MTLNASLGPVGQRITKKLTQGFAPSRLQVIDESHHHAGHAGAAGGAGHFRVRLRSEALRGLTVIACHRQVYAALATMMPNDIHAVSIDACAPTATAAMPGSKRRAAT